MASKRSAVDDVRRFQSEVASIREAPEPLALRVTVHTLIAMIIVAVLILVFAKVDRVVTSSAGKVVATKGPSILQALDPSIIKSIDVREGDRVVKGQVIATLDPTFADADVSQLSQQIGSLNAQIERASAERQQVVPTFADDRDPSRQHYIDLQRQLFIARSAQYKAQLYSFDQKIGQTDANIQKLVNDENRLSQRSDIAKKIETMRTTLLEKGAGSLLNQLTSADQHVEMLRTLESQQNSLIEARHQLASLAADREAFIQTWSSEVSKELVTAQNALDTATAQLEKARKHGQLVRLVADDNSTVLSVAKVSVGSVLKGGDTLVTVVPTETALEAEIQISAREVGFVRAGDHATLKVDAFNFAEHGTAEGVVKWISEGAFSIREDTGQAVEPFYRARVAINSLHFIAVPNNFRLIPGMTLEADINVGRRSLGAYMLDGFIRGAGSAMREP